MDDYELYVRLLTELHYTNGSRSTDSTRNKLQDVMIELRNRAANTRGDLGGQETQDSAESEADKAVRR